MKSHIKIAFLVLSTGILAFSLAPSALAHVVVRPGDAKTSAYQTFTMSVPVEKNTPTVSVKLEIPEGVVSVLPTQKPGWTIATTKQGEGEAAQVTSITWSQGTISVGYRDEFSFSAKTPDQPTDLAWKAYQTYQDGTVIAWDQQPDGDESEGANVGPFSVTKVKADSDQDIAIMDAQATAKAAMTAANTALYVAIGAGVLACIALAVLYIRKPQV